MKMRRKDCSAGVIGTRTTNNIRCKTCMEKLDWALMEAGIEIRTFGSYEDLTNTHQKDFDDFPILWMFGQMSDDKILEQIRKIGAEDLNDCMYVFGSGVIKKSDYDRFLILNKQHDEEIELFSQDDANLISMILSEMSNHEYGYTHDPYDTLMALGRSRDDFQDERFLAAWTAAQQECFSGFQEENI